MRTPGKEYRKSNKGTIVLVDISGFTQLVYNTNLERGRNIMRNLLSTIMKENKLQLNIAEIEGDAVFFYKFGKAPSFETLMNQFEITLMSFEKQVEIMELNKHLSLSLKMIVHYGEMTEYHIGHFKKLYGESVLESHVLLKNGVDSDSYVLMTDSYLEASNNPIARYNLIKNKRCEMVRGLKELCYSFFDFSPTGMETAGTIGM